MRRCQETGEQLSKRGSPETMHIDVPNNRWKVPIRPQTESASARQSLQQLPLVTTDRYCNIKTGKIINLLKWLNIEN